MVMLLIMFCGLSNYEWPTMKETTSETEKTNSTLPRCMHREVSRVLTNCACRIVLLNYET